MVTADVEKGARFKNFVYESITPIDELRCTLYELKHEPTGASIMHIACDDPENVFCLGLKTWPDSNNGAPHILEHTVLCGSEKFPVKDPFFAMTRRSLNTFMNALTGADFTCYPAASQVKQDFYNLLEVYCDAVFFPELKEMSFLQEGHRFEFQKPNDASSPLLYQGIVYNEMKGGMSSPDSRLWKAINKHLFPDLPYAFNSGGDPEEIPNLSYQGLKDFHSTYYHPSQCLFFFYGNLPLHDHLDFIDTHVLSKVEPCDPLPMMKEQKRFIEEKIAEEFYPAKPGDQTIGAFCWLTTKPTNVEDALALALLDGVLADNDGSPLTRALLESGLCTMADAMLDSESSEIPFIVICKGCNTCNGCESVESLEEIIFETLRKLKNDGIGPELAKNALHQLEFERLEIGGGGFPFGLNLFFKAALLKQHGGKPETGLQVYNVFEKLQKNIEDRFYLSSIISKYFLDNPHFVRLSMIPDPDLEAKEAQKERETLDKIQKGLSENDKESIIATSAKLKTFQLQNEGQSLDCLPKVSIADVPKNCIDFKLDQKEHDGLNVYHHETFTNHITYAALIFDLPDVKEEELPFLQLYVSLLTELGAGDKAYIEMLSEMQAHVGSISASLNLHPQQGDSSTLKPALILRGKALKRNQAKLFELLKTFALDGRCDEGPRIKELILQIHTHLKQRLINSAMGYATLLSTCHLSTLGAINSKWGGLNYYHFIDNLAQNIDEQLPMIMKAFTSLKQKLFSTPELVLTCDQKAFDQLKKEQFYNLSHAFKKEHSPFNYYPDLLTPSPQGRPIAAPVAFTSMGIQTIDSNDARSALISVATELFDNKVLHPKIREQGGAYGSGSSYNAVTGTLYFYGYRDPNLSKTIEAFHQAANEIAEGKFSEDDLEEAKLGLIQSFDSPLYPGSRGLTAYVWQRENKTQSFRQAYRERVLKAHKDDVISAVKDLLLPALEKPCVVSFASKDLLEKENKKLTSPLPILDL